MIGNPETKNRQFRWRFSWIRRAAATGSNPLDRLRREIEEPEEVLEAAMHGQMLAWPPMKRPTLALALCALATQAAVAYGNDSPAVQPFNLTVAAGKAHEECVKLQAAEKRKYYWKADAPVDFNIHYHEGPEVFYPVKRNAMRGDGGTFTAKIAQDYCWMWIARDKPVKLEGRIESK
jgi:hypothetical protein